MDAAQGAFFKRRAHWFDDDDSGCCLGIGVDDSFIGIVTDDGVAVAVSAPPVVVGDTAAEYAGGKETFDNDGE